MTTAKSRDSVIDWGKKADRFAQTLQSSESLYLSRLAEQLQLPVQSLAAFPRIGVRRTESNGITFTFPEHDGSGRVIGVVERFPDNRKRSMKGSHRGLSLPDNWRDRTGPIFIVEGVSDTLAMTHAGLNCIGRPFAMGGVDHLVKLLKEWPFERPIVVIGENDCKEDGSWPGKLGAETVADNLTSQCGRDIHVAFPPFGSKDVRDWLTQQDHGDTQWVERGRQLQVSLLANAVMMPSSISDTELRFRPFPVEVMPEPVRRFIETGALSIGCDPSYLALPLITAIGAAIGNSRRLRVKAGWDVPAILWTAMIGESGSAKTPAYNAALRAIQVRQSRAFEQDSQAWMQYENELQKWEKKQAAWKKDKHTTDDPPTKPVKPSTERYLVSDTTVEALAPILQANPRGLLLARDELSGWFGSFDRYAGKSKGGSDSANWLSMYNAGSVTIDRKSNGGQAIQIRNAAVSITGGIQPAILQRLIVGEHTESGLAARFLLSHPPRKPKRYSEQGIDETLQDHIARMFDRIYTLQPGQFDTGQDRPELVRLDPGAKALWLSFNKDHNQEQVELTDALGAAWSKLEECPLRLALILHYLRWAASEQPVSASDMIDEATMEAAIILTKWFKHETQRVYAMMAESETERDRRKLIEWITSKGGIVTARQVQQGCQTSVQG